MVNEGVTTITEKGVFISTGGSEKWKEKLVVKNLKKRQLHREKNRQERANVTKKKNVLQKAEDEVTDGEVETQEKGKGGCEVEGEIGGRNRVW